jgi:hypothetical protein
MFDLHTQALLSLTLGGSVARLTQLTDAGGFRDIALDFVFYATIP